MIKLSSSGSVGKTTACEGDVIGSNPLDVAFMIFFKLEAQWVGAGVRGHWELEFHFHHKPLLQQEIRILAQLGLGVAPRFLQKVRAQAPIFWQIS